MYRKIILLALLGLVPTLRPSLGAAPQNFGAEADSTVNVLLRTEDGAAFEGVSAIRIVRDDGHEIVGTETEGEAIFQDLRPGKYTVEASAPGFTMLRQAIEVESGNRLQTFFLVMQQEDAATTLEGSPAPGDPDRRLWIRPGIDAAVPATETGVACPLSQIASGAGRRMTELVENLQKFDATERIEHFTLDSTGARGKPETRTFDYMATIAALGGGTFELAEYRNGSTDPRQFPAQIATTGLAGMALLLHPALVSDFNVVCEGLGQWDGHASWQVHFAQRPDRPNRLRSYEVRDNYYSAPLKGRAWIDAATFQVRHIESELVSPVREIGLSHERMSIDYGLVRFQTHSQQLWLPLHADVYWEEQGRRFYRQHTFSNFKIFLVDSAQDIQAPKESYCFTNKSDREVSGTLTVSPAPGVAIKTAALSFSIPGGRRVCKIVGPGNDVGIAADEVGSAIFVHDGPAGSIIADANLVKENSLELVSASAAAPPAADR